jgi:hypothetical protein
MEVINHVITIAEKKITMEVWRRFRLGVHKIILSCLIRKNRSHYFYIEYNNSKQL